MVNTVTTPVKFFTVSKEKLTKLRELREKFAPGRKIDLEQKLFEAIDLHDWWTVGRHLSAGVNPDATDRQGISALMRASSYPCADILLKYGADPLLKCNGVTPLEMHKQAGNSSIAHIIGMRIEDLQPRNAPKVHNKWGRAAKKSLASGALRGLSLKEKRHENKGAQRPLKAIQACSGTSPVVS